MEVRFDLESEFTHSGFLSIASAGKAMKQSCSRCSVNGISGNRTLYRVPLFKNTGNFKPECSITAVVHFNTQKAAFDPRYESVTGHQKCQA
jgi:hypothetical protein